jgi:hypothetical protein
MASISQSRQVAFVLGLLAIAAPPAWPQSACDLNQDGSVNVVDVQLAVNMMNGLAPCTASINGSGVCTIVTVQRVVVAALGQACVVDSGPGPHTATLSWTASSSSNVTGYNVYRGTTSGGPYPTKVNSALITGLSYVDTTVQAGLTYYYVATAVDNGANESDYSNQAPAVIPSP